MRQALVDQTTQLWVRLTGRKVRLAECPWLEGPVGDTDVIGEKFFHRWAEREGLVLDNQRPIRGLLPNVASLDGSFFNSQRLAPPVASFYQETSRYSFGVTPQWRGGLWPFAWLIALIFSRRLRQLNVPLSALDTTAGASSEVFAVRKGEHHLFSAWVRSLASTGNTLYAGTYSTATIPGHDSPCIKVVFPLPNGSAVVLMRPENQPDGSLLLTSAGKRFGDPGFYFFVQRGAGVGVARYVKALKEKIHVFPTADALIRARHEVSFFGVRFLVQHYEMRSFE